MKASTQALLLASGLATAGYVIYQVHASRDASGWYWAFISQRPDDMPAVNAFFAKNKGNIIVRKTISPGVSNYYDVYFKTNLPSAWILFEAKGPFEWTLPGKPHAAPKGVATDIKDALGDSEVIPAITSPQHPWNEFWGSFWSDGKDGKDPNPILSLWHSLGVAGPIVVYGGAGILLFKLWGALSSLPSAPRLSASRSNPRLLSRG